MEDRSREDNESSERASDAASTWDVGAPLYASPLVGFLDTPRAEITIIGVLDVAGWVFTTTGRIAYLQAFLDQTMIGIVEYGSPRPDIPETYPACPTANCGFHAQIRLDDHLSGVRRFTLRAGDDHGNVRDFTCAVNLQPLTSVIHLDSPTPGERSAGGVLVAGWAFSLNAPIVRVEAALGTNALSTLTYGLPRPDLLALYQHPNAAHCGFWGVFNFPVDHAGEETLVVRAIEVSGRQIEANVPINLTLSPDSTAEIERALWRSDIVEVDGWAVIPSGKPPFFARIFLDNVYVGQTRIDLSRPDVRQRFSSHPNATRCGFRFRHPFAPSQTCEGQLHELLLEVADADGRQLRRVTHVSHDTLSGSAGIAGVWSAFGVIFDEYQGRIGRQPIVLDWHTHLDLAAAFPAFTIFSPPSEQGTIPLPYLDHTVDIVVCPAERSFLEEAERIATTIVVPVHGVSDRVTAPTPTAPMPPVSVESIWREHAAAPDAVLPSPTWSIVIPVYNQSAHTQACLAQLLATLPHDARGEIIVVDDGSIDDTALVLRRWAGIDSRLHTIRNTDNCGFIASCNRGAEAATADTLIFLNNDTLPKRGWLYPLLRVLWAMPDAGAVGGKLLFPDGSLQEAGGVIYNDATGCNFGKFSPTPNAPLFNFLRPVDYCSGALLATKRTLFRQIGGFDSRFAPAYYEDVDYCFALRAAGYIVYYQPESEVIHVEGATSGTDLTKGAKRYQAINREKFVAKWRAMLSRQPVPPTQADLATLYDLALCNEYIAANE